ncbi:MAG TPA: pitrilysin family protein [Blastocatellia bacterium]|nr:pitrilysin family protein [Blastocatellia bacterium]
MRILLICFLVPCCLALGGPVGGTNTREQTAAPVLPVLKRDYLLNGLQLVLNEQPEPGGLTARLRIDSGAAFDRAGKGGLADMTAGMLLKGGGGMDAKAVSETVKGLGLSIKVSVDWDSTNITLNGPNDSLDSLFDLIGRLVISPTFDQKELAALKTERVAAIAAEANDDAATARRRAMEAIYGSHTYGHPVRGTAESISQISREDVVSYHARFYLANNAVLVVTGDVKAEEVTRLARTKLGSWKKGEKVPATFQPPAPLVSRRIVIIDRASQSAHAIVAQLGISRKDKDYIAVLVMTEVLRAAAARRAGAVPGTVVQAGLDARYLTGPLWVEVTSSPDAMGQSIETVLSTMADLKGALPALDQVESAKARLISSFSERLATVDGAGEVVLDMETYGLGRDYLMNFVPRVNAITPGDVQHAAQEHLNLQALAIAAAAPASACEDGMKRLGTVTIVK